MSALAGLWRFDGRPDAVHGCDAMLSAQSIYGPHDVARWDGGGIALGRRLFRTLPEDQYDRQPIQTLAGHLVVADLRLDNRDELTRALDIPQAGAARMADADILAAAWSRWGTDCFDRLLGDFAVAIWNPIDSRLVLARDPLGQRPLHYHRGAGFFAFASMPKGLHALPEAPRGPDEDVVMDFLTLLPEVGPDTFHKGIKRVEPGCCLTVTRERVVSTRHWNPKPRTLRLDSDEAYVQAARGHLDAAVRARLRGAGGAVGAHLSGGWDSSSVAATAARLLAPSGGRVAAFTAVPRPGYVGGVPRNQFGDEGPLAAQTAALYPNIDHVLAPSTGRSPLADIDRDLFLYDRPVLNLCNAVWEHEICARAKARGLTVFLNGWMGNYSLTHHGLYWLPELIAKGRWGAWLSLARALAKNSGLRWRGILVKTFGPWIPGPLWNLMHRLKGERGWDVGEYTAVNAGRLDRERLRRREAETGHDVFYRPKADAFERRMAAFRECDLGNYNKGLLAGWGLDFRDPTADRRLIEFCLSIPMEQQLAGGRPRALARRVLADRLPAAVLEETRSGYHGVDWHEALSRDRDRVADEVERNAAFAPASAALDIARMRALVADWPTGGWETQGVVYNYRLALLRGLGVGHFLRKASGSNQ